MSAPIKPFDFDTLYADDVASFSDGSSDAFSDASSDAFSDAVRAQRFQDLKGDDLYAPADVSETSIGPVPMRRVRTLTNSPSCTPADLSQSDADADAKSETTTETGRPVRRLQSVRADAWAVPAPANWGRTRRAVGMRKIASPNSHSPRQARSRAARAQSPSSDWALPF